MNNKNKPKILVFIILLLKVEKKEIINETKVTEGEKVEEKKVTRRRKNAAMFFMYSGKDYYGMQMYSIHSMLSICHKIGVFTELLKTVK